MESINENEFNNNQTFSQEVSRENESTTEKEIQVDEPNCKGNSQERSCKNVVEIIEVRELKWSPCQQETCIDLNVVQTITTTSDINLHQPEKNDNIIGDVKEAQLKDDTVKTSIETSLELEEKTDQTQKSCEEINTTAQSIMEVASDFTTSDLKNLKESETCQKDTKQTESIEVVENDKEQHSLEINVNQQIPNSDEQIVVGQSQSTFKKNILEEENVEIMDATYQLEEKQTEDVVDMEINGSLVPSDHLIDSNVHKTNKKRSLGLSMLAQYGSDSEFENNIKSDNESEDDNKSTTDSVIEIPLVNNVDYRAQTIEIDSEVDSESSSDIECLDNLRMTIEKRIGAGNDDGNDDDEEDEDCDDGTKKKSKPKPPRVKGELLLDDLPPIQDLHITVTEDECVELGKIHSIVNQLVLVSALPNSLLLNLDTVLFLDKGQRVLGEVFDVLGQVAEPLYCVRFNSNEQIIEKKINVGDMVYAAPKTEYTQFIILSSLMKARGSDASWEHDIEPPPRYVDYSDDEEERMARSRLRNKNKTAENDDNVEGESSEKSNEQVRAHSKKKRRRQNEQNGSSEFRESRGGHHFNAYPRHVGPGSAMYPNSWHSNYYPQTSNYYPPPNYQHGPQMPLGYSHAALRHRTPYGISTAHSEHPSASTTQLVPNPFSNGPNHYKFDYM
uniref:H/ACA ribonucleoprotein complex non-core subunit NAF1 n=1 Tax=Glossina brevipalpis TaxID=37001 RepID=A0A1A9WLX3_9MUSC